MPLYSLDQSTPVIGTGTWIAPSATIIGDVRIGERCWIGPGAIIRGDFGTIVIGDETAIEDGVVIHCAQQAVIGKRVTVGHSAIVHGCTVDDWVVIGMHATICDDAHVGEWSILAEQSLVKKGQSVPGSTIYGGNPAAYIGDIQPRHRDYMVWGKQLYVELTARYEQALHEVRR